MSRLGPDDRLLDRLRWPLRDAVFGKDPGGWRSSSGGDGLEIASLRGYVTGDDVRRINWPASARTGDLQVVVPVAERALSTRIILDATASMGFGTSMSKLGVAIEATETLNRIASRHSDRVQVMTVGDSVRRGAAHQGRSAVLQASALLESVEPSGNGPFAATLFEAATRRGLLIAVSDFREEDARESLRRAAQHSPVLAVIVSDQAERSLPDVGLVRLRDPERGSAITIDSSNLQLREDFARAARALHAEILRACQNAIGVVELDTAGPHGGKQVIEALLAANKRRR
jgi:uncharacterized protein (DUF58 family)